MQGFSPAGLCVVDFKIPGGCRKLNRERKKNTATGVRHSYRPLARTPPGKNFEQNKIALVKSYSCYVQEKTKKNSRRRRASNPAS